MMTKKITPKTLLALTVTEDAKRGKFNISVESAQGLKTILKRLMKHVYRGFYWPFFVVLVLVIALFARLLAQLNPQQLAVLLDIFWRLAGTNSP